MWRNLLACGVLLVAGAAWGKPFPLCMYGVDNPADLAVIKKAGFSCFQTYRQEPEQLAALAKQAQKVGLKAVFYPNKLFDTPYEPQARRWPMLAWYLVDEPDVWRWPRSRVEQAYNRAKFSFPAHAAALVIGQGKTAIPYYDLPDVLMMDWYPVPHLPLTSFGEQVALAKQGQTALGAAKRPLWGVVQIFDWKEFKQHRPDNDRIGRFPTQAEIRFMSYHGILSGADGLFYFVFTSNGKPLPQAQPEWWARVVAVSKELARLKPVLEKGHEVFSLTVNPPLMAKTWQYKGKKYTVLLNTAQEEVPAPAAVLSARYKPLYDTQKAAQLAPYAVWVLKH